MDDDLKDGAGVNLKKPDFTFKKIDDSEINSNTILSNHLSRLSNGFNKNESSHNKLIYSTENDFYLNTENTTYIENSDASYHSYTIEVLRSYQTSILENLVLSLQPNGSYKAYLITYNTNANQKEQLLDGVLFDLSELVTSSSINYDGLIVDVFNKENGCPRVILSCCSFNNPNHPFGFVTQGPGTIGNFCPGYDTCYYEDNCEASDSNTGTQTNPNTDGHSPDTGTTPSNGPISGPGNSTPSNYYTTPTGCKGPNCIDFDDEECYISDEAFNAPYSANSPFIVDLSKVRATCDSISPPENKKFMCIYNKLVASPKFKDLFVGTFGESERLNVRFELDATLADGIGGTTGSDPLNQSTIIDGVAYSNFLIKINKNHLNSLHTEAHSTIEIARNIIHECLHAYLYVKKRNCNDGTTIDFLNNQLLGELINEYYDSSCSQFQEQHEFMFDYMIPTIAEILEDVKDDLIPVSNQNQVNDLDYNNSIYPNNPFTESHLFNWDEFYEYLSISGLQNTTEFQQEIATDSIKNYLSTRYNVTSRQFSKNYCNE